MKLSDQVCTLEQAKRLKELGVTQDSVLCFDEYPFDLGNGVIRIRDTDVYNFIGNLAMFTVAELGLMLPCGYDTMQCSGEGWHGYDLDTGDYGPYPTEAMCRGYMLIHLLETKTITAEEVNKRLQA